MEFQPSWVILMLNRHCTKTEVVLFKVSMQMAYKFRGLLNVKDIQVEEL